MEISKLEVLYDEVFLELIDLPKKYSQEEFKEILKAYSKSVSINIVNIESEATFQIIIKENWVIDRICELLNIKFNEKSEKILRYLSVLHSLFENNFCIVDDHIIKNSRSILVNYTEVIAERNYLISKYLLISLINKKDLLLCYLFIRDLIENIKVYLFFLRGAIEEEILKISNGMAVRHNINKKVKDDIHNKLENENQSWDFDVQDIIKNNPSLNAWNAELKRLKEYNDLCNSFIHKNGFIKISPRYINRLNNMDLLKVWYDIVKFYFTITAAYDGKSIESSDYIDFMDMGEEPPEECQFWIAPIFQEFIDCEFTNDEKNKIKNESYMDIK